MTRPRFLIDQIFGFDRGLYQARDGRGGELENTRTWLTEQGSPFRVSLWTMSTVSRMGSGTDICTVAATTSHEVRDQLTDDRLVVERGNDSALRVPLAGCLMQQRVRQNKIQECQKVTAKAQAGPRTSSRTTDWYARRAVYYTAP